MKVLGAFLSLEKKTPNNRGEEMPNNLGITRNKSPLSTAFLLFGVPCDHRPPELLFANIYFTLSVWFSMSGPKTN
jgi:hypothetical protein